MRELISVDDVMEEMSGLVEQSDRPKHFDIIDTWNLKYHEISTAKWVFQLDDSQSLHENGVCFT